MVTAACTAWPAGYPATSTAADDDDESVGFMKDSKEIHSKDAKRTVQYIKGNYLCSIKYLNKYLN